MSVLPNELQCATVSQGGPEEGMPAKTLVIVGVSGLFEQVNGEYNLIDAKEHRYRKQGCDEEHDIEVFSDEKGWCVQIMNKQKWVLVMESDEAGVALFAVRSWCVSNPPERRCELQQSVRVLPNEQTCAAASTEGGNESSATVLPEDGVANMMQSKEGIDEGGMLTDATLLRNTGQTLMICGISGPWRIINGRYDLTDATRHVFKKQSCQETIKFFAVDKSWHVEYLDEEPDKWQGCLKSEALEIERGLFAVRRWFVANYETRQYEHQPLVSVVESTHGQRWAEGLGDNSGSTVASHHRDVGSQHSEVAPSHDVMEVLNIQESPHWQSATLPLRQQISGLHEQMTNLTKRKTNLSTEIAYLERKKRDMQARDSGKALSNSDIKGNFPIPKDIVDSYTALITDRSEKYCSALFRHCLGEGETISQKDILSCCKASKEIFTKCNEWVQRHIVDAQTNLKMGTMAGDFEGVPEVSEWKDTQESIIKLQRATRHRILKDLNDQTHFEVSEYSETLSHKDYKKKSHKYLGPLVKELVKVLVEAALHHPPMFVDPGIIGKTVHFSPEQHQAWENAPKPGNQCMIVFPGLSGSKGIVTKAYIIPCNPPLDDYYEPQPGKGAADTGKGRGKGKGGQEMEVGSSTGKRRAKEATKGTEDVGSELKKKGKNGKTLEGSDMTLKTEVKKEKVENTGPKKGKGMAGIEGKKKDDEDGEEEEKQKEEENQKRDKQQVVGSNATGDETEDE